MPLYNPSASASQPSQIDVYGGLASSGAFTWTKPSWARIVTVYVISSGAGGGGGGGSGLNSATTTAGSGNGGSGGNGLVLVISEP